MHITCLLHTSFTPEDRSLREAQHPRMGRFSNQGSTMSLPSSDQKAFQQMWMDRNGSRFVGHPQGCSRFLQAVRQRSRLIL
ncbi:hypothetical protein M3J09_003860 [Ascochyta lentis]